MTEPESHTLAYLRRIDEKLDRLGGETAEWFDRVDGRLGRIEDELLVLNGIVLRLEGREVETTGLKALFDRTERRLAELERRMAGRWKTPGHHERVPGKVARAGLPALASAPRPWIRRRARGKTDAEAVGQRVVVFEHELVEAGEPGAAGDLRADVKNP
jgi:hypothetical protein